VRIEYDPAKDKANYAKHGVSLALAADLDWEAALVWIDDRFEYPELRMIALAPKTHILYYAAFVDRGDVRRIISLRQATRREVKQYVQGIQEGFRPDAHHARRQGHHCGGQARPRRSAAHAEAIEGNGPPACAARSPEIRPHEATRIGAIQPGGRGIFQIHG
jgi:uncharacterized DUF497 family protein